MSLIKKSDLEKLLLQLQNENLRSAYLNAFPGRSLSKFDLALLDPISEGFTSKLLSNLLTKEEFKQKIAINPAPIDDDRNAPDPVALVKRLQKLYLRALDFERERGFKVVYLGYPLVQRIQTQSTDKKILAPLFLWEVYLKPSAGYKNWFICRDKGGEIKVNTALQLYQKMEGEPAIPDLKDDLADGGVLNHTALNNLMQELLSTNYYREEHDDLIDNGISSGLALLPSQRDALFKEKASQNYYRILNSGVLGIFKASKEAIINDLQEYINMGGLRVPGESVQSATHAAIPLDPSQMQGIPVLNAEKNLVIHGPPGTGKSQVLTGLISSAVAEKQKTLVVCEKYTALEVIKNNLEEIGLSEPVALITDVKKDRKKIALIARALGEENSFVSKNEIEVGGQKAFERKHEMHVANLKQPILFEDNWTIVVGKYLALRDVETLPIPRKTLEAWTKKGEAIISSIRELNLLSADVPNYFFLKAHIKSLLEADPIKIMVELKHMITTLEEFLFQEKQIQEETVPRISNHIRGIVNDLNACAAAYTKELNLWEGLPQREKKIFREGGNLIKTIHRFFNKRYQLVESSHVILVQKKQALGELMAHLADIKADPSDQVLFEQVKNLVAFFTEKLKSLTSNFTGNLDFIRKYDPEFDQAEKHLKEYLLGAVTNIEWLSSKKASQYLDKVDVLLEDYLRLKTELTEIETYKRFVGLLEALSISDNSRQLKGLFEQEKWGDSAIKSLYEYAITQANSNGILGDEHCLDKLREGEKKYRENVKVQMQNSCSDLQQEGLSNLMVKGHNVSQVFNLRGSKGRSRNSLKKINRLFRDEFTNLFPVILTTPESASTLFKGLKNYFDVVIFDEASQVNLEDAITTLFKGRKIIVAGDEHQMPPSNFFSRANDFEEDEDEDALDVILDNESLLDFAIKNPAFENQYLDFHYRSEHPSLIDFSNAAFYGRLLPMPPKYNYRPIEYKWIGGTYTKQTNLKEAEAVIEVLKKIGEQSQQSLPSIGVATLNLKQRNLIFEKIAEEVSNSKDFRALYEQLESQNLFIKNLENIQGDERDIIIISNTFGKDENGNFRQNFGPINQSKGYRLLNVLITRAKQKVIVFSSIPSIKINEYQEIIKSGAENGSTYAGRGVFYAYLSYCKAISNGDDESAQGIINFLEKHNPNYQSGRDIGGLESPFEEVVYEALRSHFNADELHVQKEEGAFRIDIMVAPQKAPDLRIAIECDGATYPSSYESYHYDLHRQKMLEKSGYNFIRVWSKNWFLNYDGEKQKLIKTINRTIKMHVKRSRQLPPYLKPLYAEVVIEKKPDTKRVVSTEKKEKQLPLFVKKGVIVQLYEKTKHKELVFKIAEQNNISQGQLGVDSPLGKRLIGAVQGEEVVFGKFVYEVKKIISV